MQKKSVSKFMMNYAIILIMLVLFAFFCVTAQGFMSSSTIFNILRQVSIVGISAVGMTFVLITGGIDLSVGAIIGVACVGTAELMLQRVPPVLACLIMLIICALIGFTNGFFINVLRISPLISTLAVMTSLRGLAYIITGGLPVFGFPSSFTVIGQGYLGIFPIPVIIMAVVFLMGWFILSKTSFGRYVYGVGGNEESTRLSGINTKKIKYIVYTMSGLLSGIAGIVFLSRVNSGQPDAGTGYEMDVITGCVLGGVSISGGEGKIGFVVVGVVLIGILTTGMVMLNINDYVQQLVKGLVLIAAVGFDQFAQSRKKSIA